MMTDHRTRVSIPDKEEVRGSSPRTPTRRRKAPGNRGLFVCFPSPCPAGPAAPSATIRLRALAVSAEVFHSWGSLAARQAADALRSAAMVFVFGAAVSSPRGLEFRFIAVHQHDAGL